MAAFEREVGGYLGATHAIGVGSGTDAIKAALRALDIGPGDRVLTTPFTFFTAGAVLRTGAEPVFADIDSLLTFNLAPERVAEALAGRWPVLRRLGVPAESIPVLPVHLYGAPAAVEGLGAIASEHGLAVVEDAAQAIGGSGPGAAWAPSGRLGLFTGPRTWARSAMAGWW